MVVQFVEPQNWTAVVPCSNLETVTFFWALWALFIPVKLHSSSFPTVILTGLELCSLVWPRTTILLPHFLKNWDYRPASCTWLSRPLNKYLTLKTLVYPGHTQRVCHSGVPSSALRHRFDVSSQRAPKTEGVLLFSVLICPIWFLWGLCAKEEIQTEGLRDHIGSWRPCKPSECTARAPKHRGDMLFRQLKFQRGSTNPCC